MVDVTDITEYRMARGRSLEIWMCECQNDTFIVSTDGEIICRECAGTISNLHAFEIDSLLRRLKGEDRK